MKRRIIRADALNWAIQEYQEGGDIVERGRYAGQAKQAKWKAPNAFYPTLAHAARGLLNDHIGDLPHGEPVTGEALIAAIQAAEKRTTDSVQESVKELETSVLIGILQERGWTVTRGKKGQASYVEDEEEDDSANAE